MQDQQNVNPYFSGRVYRIVWAVAGLLLAGLGVYVVFFGVVELAIRIVAGLFITLLGTNAVWSSIHSKQSWLAKFALFI